MQAWATSLGTPWLRSSACVRRRPESLHASVRGDGNEALTTDTAPPALTTASRRPDRSNANADDSYASGTDTRNTTVALLVSQSVTVPSSEDDAPMPCALTISQGWDP